jgi:hypothetical protein
MQREGGGSRHSVIYIERLLPSCMLFICCSGIESMARGHVLFRVPDWVHHSFFVGGGGGRRGRKGEVGKSVKEVKAARQKN